MMLAGESVNVTWSPSGTRFRSTVTMTVGTPCGVELTRGRRLTSRDRCPLTIIAHDERTIAAIAEMIKRRNCMHITLHSLKRTFGATFPFMERVLSSLRPAEVV